MNFKWPLPPPEAANVAMTPTSSANPAPSCGGLSNCPLHLINEFNTVIATFL
jgi:hypothetical protein